MHAFETHRLYQRYWIVGREALRICRSNLPKAKRKESSECRQSPPFRTIAAATEQQAPRSGELTQDSGGIPIEPGEVHLWWLDPSQIQSPALYQEYMKGLSPHEQQFVSEGNDEQVRRERLLARSLVRTVLCRYCRGSIKPVELKFEANQTGKPYLVSGESYDPKQGQLHFNLTHTGSLLGLAVARGALVGLDVEDSSRLTKSSPLKLAQKRFSSHEYNVLKGFESAREQATLFIRLWTLKEAYVKAKGLGIAASPGLRSFGFELVLSNRTKRYEDQANYKSGTAQNSSPAASSSIEAIEQMTESQDSSNDREAPSKAAGQPVSGAFASQPGAFNGAGSQGSGQPLIGSPMGFNLGYQTASNPMASNADSFRSTSDIYPWRELIASQSQSSHCTSSSFAWGTDHASKGSANEGAQSSPPSKEAQLPVFWSFRDRTPFRIQFQQSHNDSKRWAVWLMELQGGHTSALLVEIDKKFAGIDSLKVEKQLKLRCFNTVPLQSEEVLNQSRYCRVIGFGMSD